MRKSHCPALGDIHDVGSLGFRSGIPCLDRSTGAQHRSCALQPAPSVALSFLHSLSLSTCCGAGVLPRDPALLARDFGVLTPQQTTVLVSLPLPDTLERLMRLFRVMNTVYGFLLRNHIQVRHRLLLTRCFFVQRAWL